MQGKYSECLQKPSCAELGGEGVADLCSSERGPSHALFGAHGVDARGARCVWGAEGGLGVLTRVGFLAEGGLMYLGLGFRGLTSHLGTTTQIRRRNCSEKIYAGTRDCYSSQSISRVLPARKMASLPR